MDYNLVALFARVARAGSFTKAAAELGLPKSSASRGVARLERELGVRLLQRTTRKLVLTEAGHAYYDSIRRAVSAIDEADEAARELGSEPRGLVRVTAPTDLGTPDLAVVLAQFTRKYPGIRVEMSFTTRHVDLVAEGFDMAIRAGKLEDSSLIVRRIGSSEAALFAAPSYLRRRGRPKTVEELANHDWVLYRPHAGRSTFHLSGPDGEKDIEVTGPILADEFTFCRAAAEAGAGIVFLPIPLAADAAYAGRLEQVMPDWVLPGGTINLVFPSSRQIPTRVTLLRDVLVEHLTKGLLESQARCAGAKAKEGKGPRPVRAELHPARASAGAAVSAARPVRAARKRK